MSRDARFHVDARIKGVGIICSEVFVPVETHLVQLGPRKVLRVQYMKRHTQ